MKNEIAQALHYGTYFFFLLVGVAIGLPVGWLVGFKTRGDGIPELDHAHEESLSTDVIDDSRFTVHAPEVLR